jgi:hypothetical protein
MWIAVLSSSKGTSILRDIAKIFLKFFPKTEGMMD